MKQGQHFSRRMWYSENRGKSVLQLKYTERDAVGRRCVTPSQMPLRLDYVPIRQ